MSASTKNGWTRWLKAQNDGLHRRPLRQNSHLQLPPSRVTDHRIGMTIYNLQFFMDGHIGEMIEQLQVAENAEKLKAGYSY